MTRHTVTGRAARKTPLRMLSMALAGAMALAACGGGEQSSSTEEGADGGRLSIATGNTTGVYYILGGGFADVITKNLDGYQATAEATGASVENVQRVVRGDSDIAFTLADTAVDAVEGKEAFSGPQPIRALTRIYSNYTHVVVRKDAGIDSIEDMKGKTVSTGSPNSGTEVISIRLLEAAGLDPDSDVQREKLELGDTASGLKDGTIDAAVWSGGLPTSGITDITSTIGDKVEFLDLSSSLPKLQSKYGDIYEDATIPADTYDLPADVPTIGVPNLLIVHEDMDPALAQKLTKLVFDQKPALEKVHPEAKNITTELGPKTPPVKLHQGAQKYFKSTG